MLTTGTNEEESNNVNFTTNGERTWESENMTTLLTWCEECGEDMHVNGGRECKYCGNEYCYKCIKEHEKNCKEENTER